MEKTSIQYIKEVAKKVVNSELKRLGAAQTKAAIEGVMRTVGLATKEEAVLFCAYFDKTCQGRAMDFDDVSSYFGCSTLDIMEMVPSVKSLLSKGFLMRTRAYNGDSLADITHMSLVVEDSVFSAIIGNTPIVPKPAANWETVKLDRYEFCGTVGTLVEDKDVDTERLVKQVLRLEKANLHLDFVEVLRNTIDEVTDRALFYDLAYDYYRSEGSRKSCISKTLRDIHSSFSKYMIVKKEILEKRHILIKEGLVEKFDEKEMRLTQEGCTLFFGEDIKYFVKTRKCEDIYAFLSMVNEFFRDADQFRAQRDFDNLPNILGDLEKENAHIAQLAMVKKMLADATDRAMFYCVGDGLVNNIPTYLGDIVGIFRCAGSVSKSFSKIKSGKTTMQMRGYVELEKKDSLMGPKVVLKLTDKGTELLMGEEAQMFVEEVDESSLIAPEKIVGKKLFFTDKLDNQLSLIRGSLQEETYQRLRTRLEEQCLPKGVAILLYGEPGTGKTESVMQIAKETGRVVMHVDISNTKSMWFGESEKIIKKVFSDYRRLCSRSKTTPILLFNEADAVFSKRKDVSRSNVAQTENAIQNIILEEMERLDGILVATTNLADNLDAAFERRFLFKVRYDKPTAEAKKAIWQDKLPVLADDEALSLANQYDFSGGQIDNVVRKAMMEEIVKGEKTTKATLETLCSEEYIAYRSVQKVGFC
ncbi:MAG: ATP-binding protein [Bacteroidaceae bacterium]|nr:ATP-binding protein [Bacteroidaceae bacterium]